MEITYDIFEFRVRRRIKDRTPQQLENARMVVLPIFGLFSQLLTDVDVNMLLTQLEDIANINTEEGWKLKIRLDGDNSKFEDIQEEPQRILSPLNTIVSSSIELFRKYPKISEIQIISTTRETVFTISRYKKRIL